MNKQKSSKGRGIEWTDYTWNPVGGCLHGCRWHMPDGTTAICYAETVAERVAQAAYPNGFAHHYWHPERLEEPLNVKTPCKIFLDSMSDLMGNWVSEEEIEHVLDVCRRAHWHDFQLLTKNAPRLLKFNGRIPPNVWVGVSAPPTEMFGKPLSQQSQIAMLTRSLDCLAALDVPITWMSIEPLSWNMGNYLSSSGIKWAVIGAATNGGRTYQPEPEWVQTCIDALRTDKVAIFFKGNLEWHEWYEEFPEVTR